VGARERILHELKTKGPRTAAQLARRLDVTPVAIRQQLALLRKEGAVEPGPAGSGAVGRPARHWQVAAAAQIRFPDSHGELAVGLLEALRKSFGDKGLERLVQERTRAQAAAYEKRLPSPRAPLPRRVAALARIREEEGYMAEWSREKDGTCLLVENHCPICAAARTCQGLCAGELDLFRQVLGARVERTEHLLEGARRCVYRITPE
jgi:predicted ArsR family transcriptional regulator